MSGEDFYTNVLVPTDGSGAAEAAVDHALAISSANDATIHSIFVIDVRIAMAAEDDIRDDLIEDLREEGTAAVESIAERAEGAGVPAITRISRGTPWKEILEYAREASVDLIVIGTAGKTPREKRMGLGSVSERVVDDATIPVLIVPDRR